MKTVSFDQREQQLPKSGRWLVASATAKTIVVYQSLPREISKPAIKNQRFGSPFDFNRLSWIKPSFLWTMHRTQWGQLDDCILAIHMDRARFLQLLNQSVSIKHEAAQFSKKSKWNELVRKAAVLTQWDPEYDLQDRRLSRKALQVGLRGDALEFYATELIVEIADVTDFVREQRTRVRSGRLGDVLIPDETLIRVDASLEHWLGIGANVVS